MHGTLPVRLDNWQLFSSRSVFSSKTTLLKDDELCTSKLRCFRIVLAGCPGWALCTALTALDLSIEAKCDIGHAHNGFCSCMARITTRTQEPRASLMLLGKSCLDGRKFKAITGAQLFQEGAAAESRKRWTKTLRRGKCRGWPCMVYTRGRNLTNERRL